MHESVIKSLSISEIEKIVRATSDYPQEVPKKGSQVFNIETGTYVRKLTV